MKSKRLLSMLLSMIMVVSCLFTSSFYAVASDVVAFENLYADPGFESSVIDSSKIYHYNTQTGSATPVYANETDGYVLRWDFSGNAGGAYSLGYIAGLSKTNKYVFKFNVRLADVDTNPESAYFYSADLSGANSQVRPAITKDAWATVYGVANSVAKNARENIRVKIISEQTNINSNVVDAVYEMDNLEIYDITTAKTVTFPEGVTNLTGTVAGAGSIYALPGSTVSFTYDNPDYNLESAEVTDLIKNGDNYTFTMPSANATFTEVPAGEVAFENLYADPGFESGAVDSALFYHYNTQTGSVAPVYADEADGYVLKWDFSGNGEGKYSLGYIAGFSKSNKYVVRFNVRLADVDTNPESAYFYSSDLSGANSQVRPEITKDAWSTVYGVANSISNSARENIRVKIISDQTNINSNVVDAVYEMDNLEIYDITTAKTVTFPEGVTNLTGTVAGAGSIYALPYSEVSFTYDDPNGTLKTADIADFAKDGTTYTFTMPESDVVIGADMAFKNLYADSGFENGAVDSALFYHYAQETGSVAPVYADEADGYVLKWDFSGNGGGKYSLGYIAGLSKSNKYVVRFNVRLADVDTNPESAYFYSSDLSGANSQVRPEITKDAWSTVYGVANSISNSARDNIRIKIISDQTNINSNVVDAVYEMDNLEIYDITKGKKLTLPAGVTNLTGTVEGAGSIYALPGSTVSFTYDNPGYKLESAEATDLVRKGVKYTFTMPSAAATFAPVETEVVFTNLYEDSGFESGAIDSAVIYPLDTQKGSVTPVYANETDGYVLKWDFSGNGEGKYSLGYIGGLNESNKYIVRFNVRLADVDTNPESAYLYSSDLSGANSQVRPEITKDGWATIYGVTNSARTNIRMKVISDQTDINSNDVDAVYEIDNLEIYDITEAKTIKLPQGATNLTGTLTAADTNYALPGSNVSFTYVSEGTVDSVLVNGEAVTGVDNVYTFKMGSYNTVVLAVENQADDKVVKYAVTAKKPFAIFEEDATVSLIVAEYDENRVLENLYTATVTATAGQQVDLTGIEEFNEITNWSAKTIFTWSNLDNLTPIRSACELKDL